MASRADHDFVACRKRMPHSPKRCGVCLREPAGHMTLFNEIMAAAFSLAETALLTQMTKAAML